MSDTHVLPMSLSPCPLLTRTSWTSLDGPWDFALDPNATWDRPADVSWDRTIQVPFSPETPLSGIDDRSLYRGCWYRRQVERPKVGPRQRVLLHFGAVDYRATIWVDGISTLTHEGGYTPFSLELPLHGAGEMIEIVVQVMDDPHNLAKPRGKQDWLDEPHAIWYPRTTGIWQTVWLETVHETRIGHLRWTPNLERWEIGFEAQVVGVPSEGLELQLRLEVDDAVLCDDRYAVLAGGVTRRIALSDPGIDDYRNELLWSPESPTLIRAELTLYDEKGEAIDQVSSYTALRSVTLQGDRFILNGRPYPLRLVLDQGYWPESGLTAPHPDALRRDVELAKAMGFNGVRKHQKVEDPRYLYWADQLGLLVWCEMPSTYRFTKAAIERVTIQWMEIIDRDLSHPCIVAWVPFNESWGVPNLPEVPAERHFIQALYHLTRTIDPTRPVVGNDGWEMVATDLIAIHDYDNIPERLVERYQTQGDIDALFRRERPGGRLLVLEDRSFANQPVVLSEFGGIAYAPDREGTWGYSRTNSADEFAGAYERLLDAVRSIETFSGFCYTQFADTYQEANGLLYADRTPKFPLERMATATQGPPTHRYHPRYQRLGGPGGPRGRRTTPLHPDRGA